MVFHACPELDQLLDLCNQYGCQPPTWRRGPGGVTVSFIAPSGAYWQATSTSVAEACRELIDRHLTVADEARAEAARQLAAFSTPPAPPTAPGLYGPY